MLNIELNLKDTKNQIDETDYGLKISFKLFLAIHKFIKINDNLIKEIKLYPKKAKNNLYFFRTNCWTS